MKAFIMAAGAGTRLRPLTYAIPKPMVPVVNKPVLAHTVDLLNRHGVRQVIMNLHAYPETIRRHFGDGSRFGMEISYSLERRLRGTAGGVRAVAAQLKDTFIVMSGDGLTDIDISAVVAFHRRKRALATMVLKPVDTRFEYGVTMTDRTGRIRRFIEKPRWSDVFANTVNTGMYVFEPEIFQYIPAGAFYDFGNQVWPDLLARKQRIFGYEMQEYWTDVGNLNEYRRGVRDCLDRKLRIAIPGTQVRPGVWVGRNARIARGAQLRAPCVIGDCCTIGKNAIIDPYTTIGDSSVIGERAVIRNSILWNAVTVARNVHLDNCIIGSDARVSEDISVFEGAVLNVE